MDQGDIFAQGDDRPLRADDAKTDDTGGHGYRMGRIGAEAPVAFEVPPARRDPAAADIGEDKDKASHQD